MFPFFIKNGLILQNQSGFRHGDSCVNQLLSISHLLSISLLTIYKTFVRPHLDYSDIIYEKAYNSFFHQKIESV